jgi:putative ABC transport system substrate-binding protein
LLLRSVRDLKEAGYVEGQNVSLEFRWGEGQYGRLAAYATELARRPVTVIVATGGDPAAQAAETYEATTGPAKTFGGAYGPSIIYAKTMFGAHEGVH